MWERPSINRVWQAIDTYLRLAYPKGPLGAVKARLEKLRAAGDDRFFHCDALECDGPEPTRYALRLGCSCYPHMKLVIDRSPDGRSHLFRADTHDKHCRPAPESKEYALFCQLMEQNQRISQEIESEWAAEGIPTFKTFLKADLLQRAVAAPSPTPPV